MKVQAKIRIVYRKIASVIFTDIDREVSSIITRSLTRHKRPSIEDSILQSNMSWDSFILVGHNEIMDLCKICRPIRSNPLAGIIHDEIDHAVGAASWE